MVFKRGTIAFNSQCSIVGQGELCIDGIPRSVFLRYKEATAGSY